MTRSELFLSSVFEETTVLLEEQPAARANNSTTEEPHASPGETVCVIAPPEPGSVSQHLFFSILRLKADQRDESEAVRRNSYRLRVSFSKPAGGKHPVPQLNHRQPERQT